MGSCCSTGKLTQPKPKPEPERPAASCCSVSASPASAAETGEIAGGFAWWRPAVCAALYVAMTVLMFGFSKNSAGNPLTFADSGYWVFHGAMIAGAGISFLLLGFPLLRDAFAEWRRLNITIESLFLSSALGAFVGSLAASIQGSGGHVYYDVVAIVMIIYAVGKNIGSYSRAKALAAAERLRHTFDTARVRTGDGERITRPVSEISAGDVVLVSPGEAICVDGIILEGRGYVEETAMTGEPLPAARGIDDIVRAGTYSRDGTFAIRTTASKGARELDAVLAAVENTGKQSSRVQAQADRLMRWFFPFVVAAAAATFAGWWLSAGIMTGLFAGMAVLLVACPCALGLATPIALWSALHRLSGIGLVSRKADLIENLARADRFVFDKTGTLSHEELSVSSFIVSKNWIQRENELFALITAAQAEQSHPVAQAIKKFFAKKPIYAGNGFSAEVTQIPGAGIEARVRAAGTTTVLVRMGEAALFAPETRAELDALLATPAKGEQSGRRVYVSVNNTAGGVILLREDLRESAVAALKMLNEAGIRTAILTGDARPRWREIAGTELITGLTPLDKEARVRAWHDAGERVIFVGDGINDAAAMTRADSSIAMGTGTDLAQAASDGILAGNSLAALPEAVKLSRKVFRVLRGNLYYAVAYNFIGMGLAAAGILTPVYAALIMMVSSVWVSLRAIRATKI